MDLELKTKLSRIETLLGNKGLDALVIRQVENFAWLTGGASSYINIAHNRGAAALVLSAGRRYLVTDTIEAPRLKGEEKLGDQGWEFRVGDWYQAGELIDSVTKNMKVGCDGFYPGLDLSAELIRLRINLLPEEQERFKELGSSCAQAMMRAVERVEPGQSEYEIAALLAAETQRLGILPTVNLIAADERIYSFRHPLPTDKKLKNYAMLVLCGRKFGLVCSITRLVHFGALTDDLQQKSEALAHVDAAMIAATRPGVALGRIFQIGQQAYHNVGFGNEWQLHHQGGPAGYLPREIIATPDSELIVQAGQVYAWNPSISGTKSEDTILIGETENTILTEIIDWPTIEVKVVGASIPRPGILVI